jgi:hypothetical protein
VSKKYSSFSFYKNPQRPFFIKLLASAAKKAVKVMPLFAVRILSRFINKITIDENFTYGGDHMHLRLVVKKM